jgi:hypothetical protein
MNAPFPSNPAVGQTWLNWTWNGCAWVPNTAAPALRVVVQVFNQSAPYMPSAGLVSCTVECVGGGGGGGGAIASANIPTVSGWALGGGGGGSGGYSRITLQQAQVLGGVVVTIGQGGAGGVGGQTGLAGVGGATSFGALCVANGGQAGQNGDLANNDWGAPGGRTSPGIGDITAPGSAGSIASAFYWATGGANGVATSGSGGPSYFGGMGANWLATMGQTPGVNGDSGSVGAGGDGGVSATSTAPGNGGAGGDGICIVTEYCWADASAQPSDCCPPGARVAIGWQGGMRGFDD